MKDILLFLLLVLFLPAMASGAEETAGDKAIVAEGYGSSPQDALLQAKRAAVEEGIGVMLASETEVENFMLKKDTVITQAFGAVRSCSVLEEGLKGSAFYVKISAVVSLASLTRDLMALKILLASMDKPRTMVVIREENGQSVENAIIDFLRNKGFDLVDPAQTAALKVKDDSSIQKAAEGDPLAAAKLGAENGAEYVVVGSVRKSIMGGEVVKGTGMKSGQASLTVKVVNCSNARIVATKTATGAAIHIADDIAMTQAGIKAANTLMDQKLFEAIVKSFQDTVNNGANYDIVISGVKSYGLQKSATRILEDTEGVVSVTARSLADGKLALSVLFKGSADTFCDRVDSRPVDTGRLLVTEVSGNRIVLDLQQ